MTGYPTESGTFPTKRDAELWAFKRISQLRAERSGTTKHTLGEAISRYCEYAVDHIKTGRNMALRLNAVKHLLPLDLDFGKVTSAHFADFRDLRSKTVKPATVIKELSYFSAMCNKAIKEWGWLKVNPVSAISKPPTPPHRDRIISDDEIQKMLNALGENGRSKPVTIRQQVAIAFQLALETGMRASEITGLEWNRIFLDKKYLALPKTKNGHPRNVPLSQKAISILRRMETIASPHVFEVQSNSLDALFRKAKNQCGLSGFTFHDSRHTAATRIVMSGKINPLTLCKMFGWNNPKQAMAYFNPTASQIAEALG